MNKKQQTHASGGHMQILEAQSCGTQKFNEKVVLTNIFNLKFKEKVVLRIVE